MTVHGGDNIRVEEASEKGTNPLIIFNLSVNDEPYIIKLMKRKERAFKTYSRTVTLSFLKIISIPTV